MAPLVVPPMVAALLDAVRLGAGQLAAVRLVAGQLVAEIVVELVGGLALQVGREPPVRESLVLPVPDSGAWLWCR